MLRARRYVMLFALLAGLSLGAWSEEGAGNRISFLNYLTCQVGVCARNLSLGNAGSADLDGIVADIKLESEINPEEKGTYWNAIGLTLRSFGDESGLGDEGNLTAWNMLFYERGYCFKPEPIPANFGIGLRMYPVALIQQFIELFKADHDRSFYQGSIEVVGSIDLLLTRELGLGVSAGFPLLFGWAGNSAIKGVGIDLTGTLIISP